jgi:adenosyl cobinamide kinase/adenosyl cobinamide phosphate guanylyltransferase
VVFVATAEARDVEMGIRIARHRHERPPEWTTLEIPIELHSALEEVAGDALVIIDCLTLWVSNLLERGVDVRELEKRADVVATICSRRVAPIIVVSNEVGSGIVPANELARKYRDALGVVNSTFCRYSRASYLVVAGLGIRLGSVEFQDDLV